MARPVNIKCQECSKLSFRGSNPKPECYKHGSCRRKRNYYKYLDIKRGYERKRHHYLRYCAGKCSICMLDNNLEVHHIKAQLNGGESTPNNCMTLCRSCHSIITKYYQAIRGIAKGTK